MCEIWTNDKHEGNTYVLRNSWAITEHTKCFCAKIALYLPCLHLSGQSFSSVVRPWEGSLFCPWSTMICQESSLRLRRPFGSWMGIFGITRPWVGSVVDFDGHGMKVIVGAVLTAEFIQLQRVLEVWMVIGTRVCVASKLVGGWCERFWLMICELRSVTAGECGVGDILVISVII